MDFVENKRQCASQSIFISKDQVPLYLQSGDFYKSLNDDDAAEVIEVPNNVLKATTTIESPKDVVHLLSSLRYWMVTEPSMVVINYVLSEKTEASITDFLSPFEQDFPYLKDLYSVKNDADSSALIDRAIVYGSDDLVQFLHKSGVSFTVKSFTCAAQHGNVMSLKYIHKQGLTNYNAAAVFNIAVQNGHMDCVKYLHSLGKINSNAMNATRIACKFNQVAVLQFLHESGYKLANDILRLAASLGHLESLLFAIQHSTQQLTSEVFVAAARPGHVLILRCLYEHHCPHDVTLWDAVVQFGHMPCVLYLHSTDIVWTEKTFNTAIAFGQVAVLRYLHEHDCPRGDKLLDEAVLGGHIVSVEFLREIGCEWHAETAAWAVYKGNFAMLQYLHEHGCPWSVSCYKLAADRQNLEMLDYFLHHPCEGVISYSEYFKTAL